MKNIVDIGTNVTSCGVQVKSYLLWNDGVVCERFQPTTERTYKPREIESRVSRDRGTVHRQHFHHVVGK